MKQLDRLLLLQGNRCFFCDDPIPEGEASVEHLVASANGGTNGDDNCVACCRTLNTAFGNLPFKEKLRAVLNHRGKFKCPQRLAASNSVASTTPTPSKAATSQFELVVADLQNRGASRPKKEATLKSTIAALLHRGISDGEISTLVANLAAKDYLVIKDGKVSYNLPPKSTTG